MTTAPTRWLPLALALLAALAGCGREDPAIDQGDPLHEEGIGLPPPAHWKPPAPPGAATEMIQVEPPEFSSGMFPCSRCHVGGEPAVDEAPSIPHKAHLDRDLVCIDCHDPEETGTPKVPVADTCFECHDNLEEDTERVRGYFDRIRLQDDGGYRFPRRWETKDTIPNHKGHAAAGVDCAACHGEPSNGPFVKPKSVPLMERCVGCHKKRDASVECKTCHEKIRKPQHANIVLKHAEDQRGCLDCHSGENRDVLHLVNGTKVTFTESYKLCGQCHGPKLRDWKMGLHGKRTGMWEGGQKHYLLCVHCHLNPHAPSFPPMEPDPPPTRPEDVK